MAITELPTDPITRSERDALMAMMQHPERSGATLTERVLAARFANPTLAVVRDAVAASLDDFERPGWIDRVSREVPEAFASLVAQLAVAPILRAPIGWRLLRSRWSPTSSTATSCARRPSSWARCSARRADGDTARWSELSERSVALETERRAAAQGMSADAADAPPQTLHATFARRDVADA